MTPKELSNSLCLELSKLTIANGFLTDIGSRVFRGKLGIDSSCIPCINVIEADDMPQDEVNYGKIISNSQRFIIQAFVSCDPDNPSDAAHDAIYDIKKLLFSNIKGSGAGYPHKDVRAIAYLGKSISQQSADGAFVMGAVKLDFRFVETLD